MNLIVLLGPTGIGKTDLSIMIAKHYGSPILNCDSRQIYKHINICTAAPTPEQTSEVQHYFVNKLELDEPYSAAKYEKDVLKLIKSLSPTHNTLVLSGGSMMYIDAVCNGIDDIPNIKPEIREDLKKRYENEGLDKLRSELKMIDPEYYATIDLKNPKRIIHALEVCYTSGKTYTSFRTNKKKKRDFNIIKIGLVREREELFQRINQRVDVMIKEGLLEEAKALYSMRYLNSLNTVGLKEIFKYIEGEWEFEYAIEKIKKNTRDYAKKQMTWFKHDETTKWFHPDERENIIKYIDEKTV